MSTKRHTLGYRRKREGKTNYKKRLSLLKSHSNRLVIRRSLRHITLQIVQYNPDGDKVLLAADSKELAKYGWNAGCGNLTSAYLTGCLLGAKAKKSNVSSAILDIGLARSTKGSRLYAALKGAIDFGLTVPHEKSAFPSEERISGLHIANYAKVLKESKAYEKVYTGYLKAKVDAEKIPELFLQTKEKITKGAQ